MSNWPRVKLVLEGALAASEAELQPYLAAACAGDPALRVQVETLLAARDQAANFLETPAAVLLDHPSADDDLSGRAVGPYRLRSRLGSGGMGEVYLAHDAKLERPVALKFLSPRLAADGDRLRRFHQEARAASSLNHPHIVVVHDFGELVGRPYMVTEFVEGETVRERLRRGPLPPGDTVEIAVQIAGALAAAHARGLVHRDIKPENVMVRPDGYVKLLDFGLAKLAADRTDAARTQPGLVMGTPRYMSPEQARGLEVDARSDVWSFGVVLYEMLTGRPPFAGATPADEMAAILGADPPPLDRHAPHAPPAIAAIVRRALRKDPLERYRDADELLADLRRPAAVTVASAPASAAVAGGEGGEDDEESMPTAGERRRATVVVSVVSGYDALVERLAAPQVELAIGRIRAAAVDTMREHGGVVNQSIGEEIVALFGIPVAHEDDDLRAVRAALALHARTREVALSDPGSGLQVRLQSGVHAGSVVAQRLREGPRRYAITGPPVRTAARLAAAAPADAILLSGDCHRQVAPFVRTEPGAAVALPGGSAPVTPYRVLGESGLESRLEAPERGGLTPYAGRDAELAALQAQAALARSGEGRLVLVSGEAGSGKSRLLHELRARPEVARLRVLQGRCRSYGGVSAYLPFVEALQSALQIKGDGGKPALGQIVARIRGVEPSLEPFIPLYLHLLSLPSDVFPLPRHLRGEHLQAAMLEALAAFFTSYAQRAPSLLLLEDWHWADDASRQALRHLTEVVAAGPVLVVVTARPEAAAAPDAPDHALRISLGPLDYAASLAIMRTVLAVDHVPDELARRLHERTGGNPFFLEEMCRGLAEAGVVTACGAAAVVHEPAAALQLPDSVQAVIRTRLDRLQPEGREILRVASVIGREFSRRLLREVIDAADITEAIDRLKNAGIIQQIRVVPDPVYRFKHVLTREVTYDSLLQHQRTALHRAVGRAIERCRPDLFDEPLAVLAHHFSEAEIWLDAVDYGLRAAARATELSQFADALGVLERVQASLLRLPDDAGRRDRIAEVLLRQERLCETLGMRRRQLELGDELVALLAPHGASERLTEAYLRQGDVSTLLRRFDAADRALSTALRMSRERGDAAMERNALRSIGLLRWHQGRHADAAAITETALAIDRERQDDAAVAGDLSNLANTLRSMGEHQRALAVLEEALAMPVVASDPIKRSYILHNIGHAHRALGDVGRALAYLQQADDSAGAHMLPIQRSFHLTSIAHIHLQEGRVDESLRVYREAVDLSRRARHADGLAQSLRMLGEMLFALGRDREALGLLQESAQLFAQIEDREAEAAMRHHAAVALERCGDPDATGAWERVGALARAAGDPHAELDALEGVARARRRAGAAPDLVGRSLAEALALAARLGEHRREADLRNTLGILHWERAAYGEALAQYEIVLGLSRGLGDRVHEGFTLNSIGVTLSRLRRYEEARTALEEAVAIHRQTGERLLEAHALAALGEIARTLGRLEPARRDFEASLAIRRELADHRGEGWMLHHLARTRAMIGDAAGAAAAADAAARIAAVSPDPALRRACGLADASEASALKEE